ncbi:hypothetical protein [Micromonospora sp. NPDC047074]|uniref:hypothetical protein n=1 Tax=Micromonospora sp. NPDC047074 TaxID=3154339 RepID=UPI0033F9D396
MNADPPVRRRLITLLSGVAVTSTLLAALGNPATAAPATGTVLGASSPDAVDGSYIVVLKDGQQFDTATTDRLTSRYGGTVARSSAVRCTATPRS